MKWNFTIEEQPKDILYPIEGYQTAINGTKRGPFFFSIADMCTALTELDSNTNIEGFISMPLLPKNVIYMTHTKNMDSYKLILDFPKTIHPLRYENSKVKRMDFVGFPRVLLHVIAQKYGEEWKVSDTKIFALEETAKLLPSTKLSHFPFTNVYKDTGVICWGMNTIPAFKELYELDSLYYLFAQAPFNEDLGTRILTKKMGTTFLSYLEEIDKEESTQFNDEDLIPCSYTFGDLINN